jgi:tetratricopeptide (TPR) repeat protein
VPSSITPKLSNDYRELCCVSDICSKLNPYSDDPRAYNNRAAAYTKLLAMPEALKDAEQAIKIDPTFVKAYIRKALTQQTMKELTSALDTLQKATEIDKDKKVCFTLYLAPISPPLAFRFPAPSFSPTSPPAVQIH